MKVKNLINNLLLLAIMPISVSADLDDYTTSLNYIDNKSLYLASDTLTIDYFVEYFGNNGFYCQSYLNSSEKLISEIKDSNDFVRFRIENYGIDIDNFNIIQENDNQWKYVNDRIKDMDNIIVLIAHTLGDNKNYKINIFNKINGDIRIIDASNIEYIGNNSQNIYFRIKPGGYVDTIRSDIEHRFVKITETDIRDCEDEIDELFSIQVPECQRNINDSLKYKIVAFNGSVVIFREDLKADTYFNNDIFIYQNGSKIIIDTKNHPKIEFVNDTLYMYSTDCHNIKVPDTETPASYFWMESFLKIYSHPETYDIMLLRTPRQLVVMNHFVFKFRIFGDKILVCYLGAPTKKIIEDESLYFGHEPRYILYDWDLNIIREFFLVDKNNKN